MDSFKQSGAGFGITLDMARTGQEYVVKGIYGGCRLRRLLLERGLTEGEKIKRREAWNQPRGMERSNQGQPTGYRRHNSLVFGVQLIPRPEGDVHIVGRFFRPVLNVRNVIQKHRSAPSSGHNHIGGVLRRADKLTHIQQIAVVILRKTAG